MNIMKTNQIFVRSFERLAFNLCGVRLNRAIAFVVLVASFLIPAFIHGASDVSVSTGATSGGSFSGANPNIFTPTAAAAVADRDSIEASLNAGVGVTVNTASVAAGSGNITIDASISKTAGTSATFTLNAVRDIAINDTITASSDTLSLVFSSGRRITSSQPVSSNGGDITINSVESFTLGSSLSAGTGQVQLLTGRLESNSSQGITATTVAVSNPASFRLNGVVYGDLSVSGSLSAGPAAGSLQVTGALTLQPSATTIVDIAGPNAGSTYDMIAASGAVAIAGALQLNFLNDFENAIVNGHTFTIVQGASVTGTFSGLPDGSRISLPNEGGSVKITYTETAITLSDWQPVIHELTWDPGDADAGTQVFSNTNTRAGRHYFHINAQETDIGAWKTRLTVATGGADLYLYPGSVPQTTDYYWFKSDRVGSDGLVLRSDQYTAGQDWYLLVNATAGAQWSIFTGRAWVQNLGGLGWTDTNFNGNYDIGEPALQSGSGNVSMGPEGIRFFKTTVPTGTPAWSLWLSGDTRDIAVRKSFVPFHTSTSYYDRKQAGRMLVVAPYLSGLSSTYFLSVTGSPGDVVNLDSHIQEVTDVGFNTTQSNVAVPATPYRVYRVQVPVQQIAWDVAVTPGTGDANVCVRRDNPPAEFDNDAFSEVAGTSTDSITLVPDFLTDGTWFITVYGDSPYAFTLRNGPPTITPLNYTDTKVNDQTTRAGWRFYALSGPNSIADQLGSLGWELNLANQVPGTEIAIRRNAVPSRWRSRVNGSADIGIGSRVDASGTGGFLQHPGHQADIWYVGVFTPTAPLGAFTLTTAPLVPITEAFANGTQSFSNEEPGRWRYVRIDVPAGVLGWDVRLREVSGAVPVMVVRRDQLPGDTSSTPWYSWPNGTWSYTPSTGTGWPSGNQWAGGVDWTGRSYDIGAPTYQAVLPRLVMGMGRPLEAGTYYVGVYNNGGVATSYTIDSRGIGAGQTYPVSTLAYAGGSAVINNLTPREARYYKVSIPANTPSWEVTLAPSAGEMLLAVRRGTVPDFSAGEGGDAGVSSASGGDWEVKMQKAGPERYVMLPPSGEDYLVEGDYYLAVVGEGANPPDGNTIGAGTSSGVLTSVGALPVANLGAASLGGLNQPVSLEGGQVKAYQFTVPPGTASLEVRLDNRVGNPWMSLVESARLPSPPAAYGYSWWAYTLYGFDGGTGGTVHDHILTLANPAPGTYSVCVRASYNSDDNSYPNASANLVVIQKPNILLNFAASLNGNGYSHTDSRQMIDGEYVIYQVTVPTTESVELPHMK